MYAEMLNILMCPECRKGPLQLQTASYRDDEIWSAALVCSQCQHNYPVKKGIPCLVAKDLLDMQDSVDAHQLIQKKKEVEPGLYLCQVCRKKVDRLIFDKCLECNGGVK